MAQYTILHSFSAGTSDGRYPHGSLIQYGSSLYGMTYAGGSYGPGTVFQIGSDGTGFSFVHSFANTASDGGYPFGSLVQSGSTLYGMTSAGGSYGYGTIFKIGTGGTDFSLLHSFAYTTGDGSSRGGSLIQSGSTLYGMTSGGGSNNGGSIFKIGTDGTGFGLLHSFTGGASDGSSPGDSLIQSGSTHYGMTAAGGSHGHGTIFKIGTDGTGFRVLHSFAGGASDGSRPDGSLIQSGSTLYGMSYDGGTNDDGTVFKIGTDGTRFSLLHSFITTAPDGLNPIGSLIQVGSTLYGMASQGGGSGNGTIFKIATDGTGFRRLHSFASGQSPKGSLIQFGSTLYGMTEFGGSSGDGTIFSLMVPEPSAMTLAALAAIGLVMLRRQLPRSVGRGIT